MKTMLINAVTIALPLAWAALLAPVVMGADVADFIDYSLRDSLDNLQLPGRLYVPPEAAADPVQPRPLMIFLHGAGAVGTNNLTPVQHTPQFMLDEAKARGAFLYVPQTSSSWSPDVVLDRVMTMIDRAVFDLNADDDRLYLTGSSLGGGGVWHLLSRHANRFAAALSVAGVGPGAGFAPNNFRDTGVMAVHARDDTTVSVNSSRGAVNKILAAWGEPAPGYPFQSSTVNWLLSNPALQSHRTLLDAVPPGQSLATAIVSPPELDLLYFEMGAGGHSGPGGAFYSSPIYDWMFSHGAPVPEPGSLAMACIGLATTVMLLRRRRAALAAS